MNNPVYQLRLGYAPGGVRAGLGQFWEEEPEPILAKRTQPSLNSGKFFSERIRAAFTQSSAQRGGSQTAAYAV
jgi:hypothetical protein